MNLLTVDTTAHPIAAPANHPQAGGPLWVEARPNLRRIHVLAGDILAALGKRRDIAGKGRNQHEDLTHARAWLAAHGISDLVVLHAQRLHPLILSSLIRFAQTTPVHLWLVHQPPRSDTFIRALARRHPLQREPSQLPQPPNLQPAGEPNGAVDAGLPVVPTVEFTMFRAAYRRLLTPADAALVDARFDATARRCHQHLQENGAGQDAIAELLHTILNPAPTDPELIVDLRALQTVAWHHDLYLKINLTRLLHSEERPRHNADQADTALNAYRQPYRALCAALTRHGHGVADIADIRIADAHPDGHVIACSRHHITLGPTAACALRAQLRLRADAGGQATDPLLPHTPKALAKALHDSTLDLGIHLHGRRAERTRDHTRSALRALGITITPLP